MINGFNRIILFGTVVVLLAAAATAQKPGRQSPDWGKFLDPPQSKKPVPASGESVLAGAWQAAGGGVRVRVVFGADGAFTRSMNGPDGAESVRGRYAVRGSTLTIEPEGAPSVRFMFRITPGGKLQLTGGDGAVQELTREGAALPGKAPAAVPDPAAPPPTTARQAVPGGVHPLMPDWVRPGLRLTYYVMTGSLPGSVNGWVPDEEGQWVDRAGHRYATERRGYGSHGLIQATVVGLDGQNVAIAEPFYLFNADDTTPVLNSSLDMLATPDTGGDFWMHPRRQMELLRQHPWTSPPVPGQMVARIVRWTESGQTYTATAVAMFGDTGRTFYVFDQASGRLLYLSRLTRQPPEIRDPAQTLPDSVSHATFLRFVAARQLRLPWLESPLPEWAGRVQALSYRGQFTLQGPGLAPTPMALADDMQVTRRGSHWLLVKVRSQMQGNPMPGESTAVTGPGSLPPLGIAPAVMAALQPGQVLDQDPQTGFTVRVSQVDAQSVTLQTDGPRQAFSYVYDRGNGLLVRRISRQREPSTPDMVRVYDIQLTGWR